MQPGEENSGGGRRRRGGGLRLKKIEISRAQCEMESCVPQIKSVWSLKKKETLFTHTKKVVVKKNQILSGYQLSTFGALFMAHTAMSA